MLSFCVAFFSLNVSADSDMSVREIMERVDEESRKSTDSAFTFIRKVKPNIKNINCLRTLFNILRFIWPVCEDLSDISL